MTAPLAPPGLLVRKLEPLLKLPVDPPHVPLGARDARVFRAAPAYLRYRYTILALGAIVEADLVIPVVVSAFAGGVVLGVLVAVLAAVATLVLIVLFYAATRLDYDLRQYVVTDRALRTRAGAIVVSEATITYANVQDVEIKQGPLQRLFGIFDLVVHTAGGSSSPGKEGKGKSGHRGALSGIDNPREVRELILARLRAFRDAGLGDPEDVHRMPEAGRAELGPALDELRAALSELRGALHG
jgi:membrane protein YdbS with pleckstrin-like domain